MKALIVEDNFTCRLLMQRILAAYGENHIATDGNEALQAFCESVDSSEPYQVIFLDIMMPEMDGQAVLKKIRAIENEKNIALNQRVKIIMTTSLDDSENLFTAFREQCDAYLTKPISKDEIIKQLKKLGLIA